MGCQGRVLCMNSPPRQARLSGSCKGRLQPPVPPRAGHVRSSAWLMVRRLGGRHEGVGSPSADPRVAVLPTVLSFRPEVRARVLYCLPGVAAVCTNPQRKRGPKRAGLRLPGPTEAAKWPRVGAWKARRRKRLGSAAIGVRTTLAQVSPTGLEPVTFGSGGCCALPKSLRIRTLRFLTIAEFATDFKDLLRISYSRGRPPHSHRTARSLLLRPL